jgi:hypothetical protein
VAFAAPVLVEGAAGTAAASGAAAGAGAAEGAGAGAARAGAGTAGARGTTRTAAGRAGQLHTSGTPRYKARRALRDEFGATGGQADDLLDAASTRAGADAPADEPADPPTRRSSPAPSQLGGQLGRSIGDGLNSSGGFVLGALAYVLFLVYLRGGTPGVQAWLKAKFLNRVDGAPPAPATTYQVTPPTLNAGLQIAPGGGAPALSTPTAPTTSSSTSTRTWNA